MTGTYVFVIIWFAFALAAGLVLILRTYAVEERLRRRLNRASWWFREHGDHIAPTGIVVPALRGIGILMVIMGVAVAAASAFELLS